MISNQRLIDHNLLVGFKHYKCFATVKVLWNIPFKQEGQFCYDIPFYQKVNFVIKYS